MKKKKEVRPKYKPVIHLQKEQNLGWETEEGYFVDFDRVGTKELIGLLRGLTIFTGWQDHVRASPIDREREKYFERLEKILGKRFTEVNPKEQRKIYFLNNKSKIEDAIRKVLSTREHIPNKKEGKEIRRKKAQGKYVVD